MTDFEKAKIRLKVWEALAGWGTKKEADKLIDPWDWNDRIKYANLLLEWVMIADDTTVSRPNQGGE
jgi:hypothetical protein